MSKSVFDQQGCCALTFALARLSCNLFVVCSLLHEHVKSGYGKLVSQCDMVSGAVESCKLIITSLLINLGVCYSL